MTEPARVPPLMTALAQIGGLLAAINPDSDDRPITPETVAAAIRDVRALRDEVQQLQAPGSAYDLGQQRQSDVDSAAMDRLRARVAELEGQVRQAEVERRAAYQLAQAAEKRADELLWIESTSCCGVEANQYGVRARNAEAQVAEVWDLLPDPLGPDWETACVHAVIDIRRTLDAAGTASAEPDTNTATPARPAPTALRSQGGA